eukprot:4114204-Prymnesium_polylepis.1
MMMRGCCRCPPLVSPSPPQQCQPPSLPSAQALPSRRRSNLRPLKQLTAREGRARAAEGTERAALVAALEAAWAMGLVHRAEAVAAAATAGWAARAAAGRRHSI